MLRSNGTSATTRISHLSPEPKCLPPKRKHLTILLKRDFNTQTFCTARGCSLILFTLIHVSAGMCVLVPGLLMCSGICSSTFVSPVTECRHEGDLFIELARAPGITACIRETPLRICSYASRIRSLPICSSECLFLLWTLPTWQQ
jgi:hypothetical protein